MSILIDTSSKLHLFVDRLSRLTVPRSVGGLLAVAAVGSCIATYFALTRRSTDINTVYWLLNLDLILFLLVGGVIARQVARLWSEKKRGVAGSTLRMRLILVFGILAAVPAVLMAVFSSVFLYFGVQAWFNDRVSTAVNESLAVAQAYLKEHQQVMRADVLAMENDLNREVSALEDNPALFKQLMQTQSMLRNLPEAIVFRSTGEILARSNLSFSLELDRFPPSVLERANAGDVVLMTGDGRDRIRALVKLDRFFDAYLYVGRLVDANVLQHMQTAERAVREYTTLDGKKSRVQIAITVMFMAVALLLLLSAVWFGLVFAEQLVTPIGALIFAAERIRAGDLSARVPEQEGGERGDIALLGRSFNRMTRQLQNQQAELLSANRMLDERRRFTEAVLSGASSGVIGIDAESVITLANARAEEILLGAAGGASVIGKKLSGFIPETEGKAASLQLEYAAGNGPRRTILVRLTAEQGGDGAVVTIDDISALVSAQRSAAWADVARRIAHEIKNPLTPIQLSAERLRRKYLPQIQDDPETFARCTDTIIRQVADIGHMVGEFSSYARLPGSVKAIENVVDICQSALILQKEAHPEIVFGFIAADPVIEASCDRAQLMQVITNLLQNAIDSVHDRMVQGLEEGRIKMVVEAPENKNISISIEDNGLGLPEKVRDQLLEPYVTTKKKGSGLGLAIVKKIMEDHAGGVVLEDAVYQEVKSGAKAVIVFPRGIDA